MVRSLVERPEEEWTVVAGDLTPAIITPEEWARANERPPDRRGFRTRDQYRPMLLRGRLIWSECGASLYADHAARPGRRSYYRCRNAKSGRSASLYGTTGCPGKVAVPADATDGWVWREVAKILANRDAVAAEIRRRLDRPAGPGLAEERERLAVRLREIAAGQQHILEREGSIAWEVIEDRGNDLEVEKSAIRPRLAAIETTIAGQASECVRLEGLEELIARLGPRLADPDIDTKSLVLDELGVRVLVNRRVQKLEWGLPLPAGDESGWAACIDFTGVGEPTDEQVVET